jgi:serine protease Do
MLVLAPCGAYAASLQNTIQLVQPKIVKIYGAGGFRGMEGYQTGMLVSPTGHVLTAFSHVLDTEYITAVLADGRKFTAKLLGADPRLEIAVLKIDAADLPYFDLAKAVKVQAGEPILAFSNAFGVATGDEPASVQRGTVAVVAPLEARRGAFETPYHGPIYVLDSTTNNAGAAGGALVTRRGELVGMLGKELRNALNDTWLNYAVPVDALSRCVEDIRAGKFVARSDAETARKPKRPLDLAMLGIALVPDVLPRTPPYVDQVRPGSPADKAGIRPDDLILLLGDRLAQTCKTIAADLEYVDEDEEIKLTILRGQDLIEATLHRDAGELPGAKKGQP